MEPEKKEEQWNLVTTGKFTLQAAVAIMEPPLPPPPQIYKSHQRLDS